jgi:hypothetical protein
MRAPYRSMYIYQANMYRRRRAVGGGGSALPLYAVYRRAACGELVRAHHIIIMQHIAVCCVCVL